MSSISPSVFFKIYNDDKYDDVHRHCSAQLSMFSMEKRYRNKIIIIIIITNIIIIMLLLFILHLDICLLVASLSCCRMFNSKRTKVHIERVCTSVSY